MGYKWAGLHLLWAWLYFTLDLFPRAILGSFVSRKAVSVFCVTWFLLFMLWDFILFPVCLLQRIYLHLPSSHDLDGWYFCTLTQCWTPGWAHVHVWPSLVSTTTLLTFPLYIWGNWDSERLMRLASGQPGSYWWPCNLGSHFPHSEPVCFVTVLKITENTLCHVVQWLPTSVTRELVL